MSPHMKFGIAGAIIGFILFLVNPFLAVAVIALAIAVPVILYRMLDPSQRARLRRARRRRELGG
jgi:hypothetical protein